METHAKFLAVVIALIAAFPSQLFAQEDASPGITPDSIFYGLDKAFEKIKLILARDEASKARLHLEFAAERIAEARVMANKGKPEFVNTLVRGYQEEIEGAETEIARSEAKGENMAKVRELVAEATLEHITVLQDVYAKVPEAAKPAIGMAMNVSRRGHEEAAKALGRIPAIVGREKT